MKKRLMRLLPVLIALVMVFGSSLTVFAADNDVSAFASRDKFIAPDGTEYIYSDLVHSSYQDEFDIFMSADYSDYTRYIILDYNKYSDRKVYYIMYYSSEDFIYASFKRINSSNKYCIESKTNRSVLVKIDHIYGYDPSLSIYIDSYFDSGNSYDDLINFIVCSTHTVYSDSSGSEVFMNAPTPMIPTVLAPITKKVGMTGALEQVMAILPIGLACLVGWIALRKALTALRSLLHQA